MRFLFDQSTDRRLVPHLRDLAHDVTVVAVDYRSGLPDSEVLAIAARERRIVVTEDRDFADLVFRHRKPHSGILYLRLPLMELTEKIVRLDNVLKRYPEDIVDFVVVTASRIRARRSAVD